MSDVAREFRTNGQPDGRVGQRRDDSAVNDALHVEMVRGEVDGDLAPPIADRQQPQAEPRVER